MGLDLFAVKKNESFNEKEYAKLQANVLHDKEILSKLDKELDQLCISKYGSNFETLYITASESFSPEKLDIYVDQILTQFELLPIHPELNNQLIFKPEYLQNLDISNFNGDLNCVLLDYWMSHSDKIYWNDVYHKLKIDKKQLKNGEHIQGQGSFEPFIIEPGLLPPENITAAIQTRLNSNKLSESDLKIIAFMEKYSDHHFAFL